MDNMPGTDNSGRTEEQHHKKGAAGRVSDRVWVVVFSFIFVGLAVAFLLRGERQPRPVPDSTRPTMASIAVRSKENPKVIGFTRDPREAMPRIVRERAPGRKRADRKPVGRSRSWAKFDREMARRVARGPQVAWSPRARTPVPKDAKYPDDPPPERAAPIMRVLSEPPGQPVFVDGVVVGATPISRRMAPDPTSVEVRVGGIGYEEVRKTLTPDERGDYVMSVALRPVPIDRPLNEPRSKP
ncbi:MAG: PEGA domain-containing protein [Deltaproteobacteria bacterium]|nr:PEGA domain-containing protein [Deltaproteobacteria bacterium]